MDWIYTNSLTNENAPKGKVLVQYLEPSFGSFTIEHNLGYFDNPKDYENEEDGKGWLSWFGDRNINVLAYCLLHDPLEHGISDLTQSEFKEKFGSFHPNLGNII